VLQDTRKYSNVRAKVILQHSAASVAPKNSAANSKECKKS